MVNCIINDIIVIILLKINQNCLFTIELLLNLSRDIIKYFEFQKIKNFMSAKIKKSFIRLLFQFWKKSSRSLINFYYNFL